MVDLKIIKAILFTLSVISNTSYVLAEDNFFPADKQVFLDVTAIPS